jgi:tetratricopeptide (TPR) repeat protein
MDILKVGDLVSSLEDLYNLLDRYGHPDFRLVVTVSPVPMNSTFSGKDVLSANSYSKSALRAAAEEFSFADRVDYFPSYEIVTLTDRNVSFTEDNIHVNSEIVGEIVERFVSKYCTEKLIVNSSNSTPTRERILSLVNSENFQEAKRLFLNLARTQKWKDAGYTDFEFYLEFGRTHLKADQPVAAEHALQRAIRMDRSSPEAAYNLGLAKRALKREDEAELEFARACKLNPRNPLFYIDLAKSRMANSRFEGAAESLKAALVHGGDGNQVSSLLAACKVAQDEAGPPGQDAGDPVSRH